MGFEATGHDFCRLPADEDPESKCSVCRRRRAVVMGTFFWGRIGRIGSVAYQRRRLCAKCALTWTTYGRKTSNGKTTGNDPSSA